MAANASAVPRPERTNSNESNGSFKSPRTPRFAEATAVNSPIDGPAHVDFPTNHYRPQPQPADVGFGYLSASDASRQAQEVEMEEERQYIPPATPASPLKSAMKSPGQAPRNMNAVLSPTFREEQVLEKQEEDTEQEQAKDLVCTVGDLQKTFI